MSNKSPNIREAAQGLDAKKIEQVMTLIKKIKDERAAQYTPFYGPGNPMPDKERDALLDAGEALGSRDEWGNLVPAPRSPSQRKEPKDITEAVQSLDYHDWMRVYHFVLDLKGQKREEISTLFYGPGNPMPDKERDALLDAGEALGSRDEWGNLIPAPPTRDAEDRRKRLQ